jgi:hypothetical protein
VTLSSALAALSAGLDRDEQLARAAASRNAAGDPSEWWTSGPVCDAAEIVAGGVRRDNGHGGTGVFDSITVARSMAIEDALHIVNVDPRRVLRQSEKLRDAAALLDDALNGSGPEPDLRAVCTDLAEILASIYDPEDTTETEKP